MLLSQFFNILQVRALQQHIFTSINAIVYRFLWKRKYNNNNQKKPFEKIKRSVLNLNLGDGGLNMMQIENQLLCFLQNGQQNYSKKKDLCWAQIVKQLFKPLITECTERKLTSKLQASFFFFLF